MLLKNMHLSLIRSIQSTEIDLLLFCVSMNILNRFIKQKRLFNLRVLSCKTSRRMKSRSSQILLLWRLNKAFILQLFKLLSFEFRNQWGLPKLLRLSCLRSFFLKVFWTCLDKFFFVLGVSSRMLPRFNILFSSHFGDL